MSDIQDLIHKTSIDCIEKGRKMERESIIKLLEEQARECEKAGLWSNGPEIRGQLQELHIGLNASIALIKGEK